MRFFKRTGGILAIVLLLSIFSSGSFSDFQKTEKSSNQFHPAIFGDIIVWEDDRHGNLDIYGYDLLTKEEVLITTTAYDQQRPAIYNDIVVWQDDRHGNWDIYGYNLSKSQEFRITTDKKDQQLPTIYNDIVVWQDDRHGNWDIYGYDLSKSQEFRITTDKLNQQFPTIYNDIVVWQDNRHGNWDIYGYDLSKSQEFRITTDKKDQQLPAIYNDIVVWQDNRHGNWDIYGYDLSKSQEVSVTTNPNDQRSPAIYWNTVVWYDNRHGNWDIYGYTLLSREEITIITDDGNQRFPAIYEDTVVWMDKRNDKQNYWDIYGYNLSTREEFAITTSPGNQLSPAIYKDIVVCEDNRHGNWDIYGYDLLTKKEFRITTDKKDQQLPAIYKDFIVWQDNRHGNWDIYGYDLLTKKEFQITTDPSNQQFPAIYKDIVVWEDDRNYNVSQENDRENYWDIYGYNLSTKEEFAITTSPGEQLSPAIYNDTVVWQDDRHGNWDIYSYNLLTKKELQITTDKSNQQFPAIYKDIVVWEDTRHNNLDIYSYNLLTKKELQITTNEAHQWRPKVHGDTVVWYDERNKILFFDSHDIYSYNLSTKKEDQITTDGVDQSGLRIYGDTIVWCDKKNYKLNIYCCDFSDKKKLQITKSSIEPPSLNYHVYAGVLLAITAMIILIYRIVKYNSNNPPKKIQTLKVYGVNALKDPLSNFIFSRWQNYFSVLLFFFFLQVVTSFLFKSLTKIDINSLPREGAVLLWEEAFSLPMLKEPAFILYYLTAIFIFFAAQRFFSHVSHVFDTLFRNKIIKKKESTTEKVQTDLNNFLREFEDRINGNLIYVPGILIFLFGLLSYIPSRHVRNPELVSWRHFCFFPANWILFAVVALLMFFTLGILIGKLICVVYCMNRLNRHYDLVLKPYDIDGLGGFKPLEQLWFNMTLVAVPFLVDIIILLILNRFLGTVYYPLWKSSNLLLCNIVIVSVLICSILIYYRIVETRKDDLLEDIRKKSEKYYTKIEETLITEKEEGLDKNYIEQIKQFQEVALKVKSIPSFPFTTLQKILLFLSAAIPWADQIISYLSMNILLW